MTRRHGSIQHRSSWPWFARFRVSSAEKDPPQARNRGVQRLRIRVKTRAPVHGKMSRLRLAVRLSPRTAQQPQEQGLLPPLISWPG